MGYGCLLGRRPHERGHRVHRLGYPCMNKKTSSPLLPMRSGSTHSCQGSKALRSPPRHACSPSPGSVLRDIAALEDSSEGDGPEFQTLACSCSKKSRNSWPWGAIHAWERAGRIPCDHSHCIIRMEMVDIKASMPLQEASARGGEGVWGRGLSPCRLNSFRRPRAQHESPGAPRCTLYDSYWGEAPHQLRMAPPVLAHRTILPSDGGKGHGDPRIGSSTVRQQGGGPGGLRCRAL